MAMSSTVTLTGLKAIDRRFDNLTGSMQRKFLRMGARAAGSVLMKETRKRAPDRKLRVEDSSRKRGYRLVGLKRSMKQIPSSKWQNAAELRAQGIIGSRVGFGKGGKHAHLVERGHEMIVSRGPNKGKRVGFVAPRPFMRPAADASRSRMRRAFQKKLIAGIRAATR